MSIDTLKLAKRLQAASVPQKQAEAIAEGIGEMLKEVTATKEDLAVAVAELRIDLSKLKTELIFWVVGTVGLGAVLNHFWH